MMRFSTQNSYSSKSRVPGDGLRHVAEPDHAHCIVRTGHERGALAVHLDPGPMAVLLVDDPGAGKRADERPGVAAEQLAEWIAASGFAGVQPAHSAVFQPLWQMPEGARITTLARASRITKQSMSTLITDLEAGGYVERVGDPHDARATRVRLTARGRAYGKAVRAFALSIEQEWARRIGAQRVEELRATLELLRPEVFLAAED